MINSMLTPFKGDAECNEFLDPNDYKSVTAVVKLGNTYPDLCSQASYLNQKLKNQKEALLEEVEALSIQEGSGCVDRIIDSIYNYIANEIEMLKDNDSIELTDVQNMSNEIYNYGVLAKGLLSILNTLRYINKTEKEIEYTKKHVLL